MGVEEIDGVEPEPDPCQERAVDRDPGRIEGEQERAGGRLRGRTEELDPGAPSITVRTIASRSPIPG